MSISEGFDLCDGSRLMRVTHSMFFINTQMRDFFLSVGQKRALPVTSQENRTQAPRQLLIGLPQRHSMTRRWFRIYTWRVSRNCKTIPPYVELVRLFLKEKARFIYAIL